MTANPSSDVPPFVQPPRHSKLPREIWSQAAALFDREAGKVRLRVLCAECGVSHRTAWRMREHLRDARQFATERSRHPEPC